MSFAECEWTYFEMMSLHNFDGKMTEFEEEVVRKIPLHVQKYMEVNNTFAYDLDYKHFDNKRAAEHKKQQTLIDERHAQHFKDELEWRGSVVDIKGFL